VLRSERLADPARAAGRANPPAGGTGRLAADPAATHQQPGILHPPAAGIAAAGEHPPHQPSQLRRDLNSVKTTERRPGQVDRFQRITQAEHLVHRCCWGSHPCCVALLRPGGVGMGRPERPLNGTNDPIAAFAHDLRELRKRAGNPSYRELARTALFAPSVLSSAASGHRLPTLPVTLAFVASCGGDRAAWERRWRKVAGHVGTAPESRDERVPTVPLPLVFTPAETVASTKQPRLFPHTKKKSKHRNKKNIKKIVY